MTSAKKQKTTVLPNMKQAAQNPQTTARWNPRDNLGEYLPHPERYLGNEVVEYDDDFVVLKDRYPKGSVHLLLLPRDPELSAQHPLIALTQNPKFLASVQSRVPRVKRFVADELRRRFGQTSAADEPYQTAYTELMSSSEPPTPEDRDKLLPPGRDWLQDVVVGVHTHPSMNHMHIHIMSREGHSECLRHKKHYLSFNSSFFVQLHEFPLDKDSERYHAKGWADWDMVCWRCGKNFSNRFKMLKAHLEEEFERWKRE